MRLADCYNFHDFRRLAKARLPGPIFNYIDGAADDEATYRRNTASFESCDLVPNVLRGVDTVDLGVTVMGQKLAAPFYCSPTALQRLFHHQGERAVAAAAAKVGTMFGVSSLGTVSLEELRKAHDGPQVYQFYFHKDRGLNRAMMQRAKEAGVQVMMLTVDSITGGNRERDLRTGFSIPFRLTLGGLTQFALKPAWGLNYVTHERFRLPQLDEHVDMGGGALSISRYFTEMLDPTMNWDDVAGMVREWNGQFCLKGIMSAGDATRAAEIGCTGIVVSNHGGRQLDGARASFDQLAEIVDAVSGPGRRADGWRRSARLPRAESAVGRREGRRDRPLLSLSTGGGRPAGRGAGASPPAGRDRARPEVDGLRRDQPALARQSALPVRTLHSLLAVHGLESPSLSLRRELVIRLMPRFKLTLEYDGAPFVGWQRQDNGVSVQETLERAIFAMTGERALAHGAGRTDAGVHAAGQVAHVDLSRDWAPFRLAEGLNAHLVPNPVAVRESRARGGRFRRPPQRARPLLSSTGSSTAARR